MLSLPGKEIFLVAGVTDMRKAYNGLAAIVSEGLGMDPLGGQVFVFCNRRRDRVKILVWDRVGYWLFCRRLEQGTFAWPEVGESTRELSPEELILLLGGIDLKQTKHRPWYRRSAV